MTENKQERAFGLWSSQMSAAAAGQKLRMEEVQFDSSGKSILWLEGRSGTGVIVRQRDGDARREITGAGLSVHGGIGYGGGEFTTHGDTVFFADKSGRLYKTGLDQGQVKAITPPYGAFADPQVSPDGLWVLSVFSDSKDDFLCVTDSNGVEWPVQLVRGADFYMSPRWHPAGKIVAWIEWDHPNMPWDGTRLMLGRLDGNPPRMIDSHSVAGGADQAVSQPQFSSDGRYLSYLVSNGEWEDLVLLELQTGQSRVLINGDGFHLAQPAWVQGMRFYGWTYDNREILYIQNQGGFASLWRVEIESGETRQIDTLPYTWLSQLSVSNSAYEAVFLASSPGIPTRVVRWDGSHLRVMAYSDTERLPEEYYPTPSPLQWKAGDGSLVYGTYYAPANPDFSFHGLPPVILYIHGGPTSEQPVTYSTERIYFTSRGYAWLDVNYRGSSGFGRSYLQALRNHWGETDVEDAADAARALIENGLADPNKLIIRGGSAGGYTVLNALIHHPGLFKAGICLYGVSNLFTLVQDTHKFEAHYNDSMVGSLPEAAEKFHAWSPIFHAEKIQDALAIFQGSIDRVVPPAQSEEIVSVIRRQGIPFVYKLYEGEGHGFRKDETLTDFLTEVERFLQQFVLFAV
jgi:dipeptidyl aminopeptidase/acylaminoacyl peptidase